MMLSKKAALIAAAIAIFAIIGVFQNCAKGKFVNPDLRHSAFALGLCQNCGSESGQGISCRQSQASTFSSCHYESCNSGFQMDVGTQQCAPVVCTAGVVANCEVARGEGRRTCNANGNGYSSCTAISCFEGFELNNGECLPIRVCEPNTTRDCGTESTTGVETCTGGGFGYAACVFGDCKTGYQRASSAAACEPIPSVCAPNSTAACDVQYGMGSKTCNSAGSAYAACTTVSCATGFQQNGAVCEEVVAQICAPASHRDCGTPSTEGVETCNGTGTAYGACVMGECKPGYNKESGAQCVANLCESDQFTPCSEGAGSGFKKCNSIGSQFGACELTACQAGYTLQNQVCVVQVCAAGSKSSCSIGNGSGQKTCNSNGLDYGSCVLEECNDGYYFENGQCVQNVCTPGSHATCQVDSGSGKMTCQGNGRGFGSCHAVTCNEGFKVKGSLCVTNDYCDAGETEVCTKPNGNGTGIRQCNASSHKFNGNCQLTACNAGYVLKDPGESATCKKK